MNWSRTVFAGMLVLAPLAAGCAGGGAPPVRASERWPGGATTVARGPTASLVAPAANLDDAERAAFYAGKALATQSWVRAPTTTTARDGLGPLYSARSCLSCHVRGGRGESVRADGPLGRATAVRVSLPGRDPITGGPSPEPTYGSQLHARSTSLAHQLRGQEGADSLDGLRAEATVEVRWIEVPFTYPDGTIRTLRRPELDVTDLGFGPLHPEARISLRHAPSMAGVGLLEQIPDAAIAALADPDDRDGDGISGRVNEVWDPEAEAVRPGRFGLKANQSSVRVQVAAALRDDMGITSSIFPAQPCTEAQAACLAGPHGAEADGYEIDEPLLALLVGFDRHLGVVERRADDHPGVLAGRGHFHRVGCADCHTPHFTTRTSAEHPRLSDQEIWPYTDLLLHDMGPDLDDGREDHVATGREWRTAPLWGVGLARAIVEHPGLLHDGRARTVEEAVLWHGGEAAASRDRFASLDREQRGELVSFVRSL